MSTMRRGLHASFPVVRSLLLLISVAAMVFVLIPSIIGAGEGGDEDVPDLYFTEIQSTGTRDEWVELANTGDQPVNLYEYAITTEGGWRGPSSFFGGFENLSGFGTSALFENLTFYLNAEHLYQDVYYAPSDDPLDQFYLLRIWDHNEWGAYYHLGEEVLVWWDGADRRFINETERDLMPQERLEDHIYQITLQRGWFHRYLYVRLDQDDPDKYRTNQTLFDDRPDAVNGTEPLTIDLRDADWNNETRELMEYLLSQHNLTIETSGLRDLYVRSDLTNDTHLDLTADSDGSFLTMIDITTSPYFWTISSLPHEGLIFVNDNHPDTIFYYDLKTGNLTSGPGQYVVEIDLTNDEHFTHHVGQPFFDEPIVVIGYEGLTIDLTDPNLASQITTVHLQSPIFTDTVHANQNTGAIASGPGDDIVKLTILGEGWVHGLLFPRGTTYLDYTTPGVPVRSLDHLIVVEDTLSDPNGNKNELLANGRLYIWDTVENDYHGPPVGWGTGGPAPEPTGLWSAQAYFDGDRYHWGSMWTLGLESKGEDNSVAAPAYGTVDVVINEINPAFFELYNRGVSVVSLSGWKLTGNGNQLTLSGSIAPGGFVVIPAEYWWIPFTPGTGGRVSLFDDLGVLTSSVGFQTDVSGNQYSWCARHIDGVGVDYRFNDTMGQPWANGVAGAQKNADWDHAVLRSTASENYDGLTFL